MERTSDVVVIGGGVIGLFCAHFLQLQGAQVTVLDAGEMGHGSSLHNAGYVSPSHFVPLASPGIIAQGLRWMLNPVSPFYIKPRFDADLLAWALRFRASCTERHVRRSVTLLRDLGSESLRLLTSLTGPGGLECEFTPHGLLILFRTGRGEHACREEDALAREIGVASQLLTREQIQTMNPENAIRATGGLYFPDDCHLTPAKLVSVLAQDLERRGVQLLAGRAVSRLEIGGNRIIAAVTDRGAVRGREFVLAAGSWSPLLARSLRLRLLVQAGKGYSVTIPRMTGKPALPMILQEARVAITPMPLTLRVAGTMEIAGVDLSITRRRVDAILQALPEYLGGLEPSDFEHGEVWAGLRPVTPDGIPYIGRFRDWSNLIAATGHAMVGVTLAPVTGAIVADLVAGRNPAYEMSMLSPDRFS